MRCILLLIAIAWLSLTARAADYYVATNGAHLYPFTNWAMAATNIQDAVSAANTNGDTVFVSNGLYCLTNNMAVTNGITVRSWNQSVLDPDHTILDGQGLVACVFINHSNACVSGFTITNGTGLGGLSGQYGGGVEIQAGGVLSNCVVTGNRANQRGGGVYVNTSGLITDCRVIGNRTTNLVTTSDGGGIFMEGSNVAIRDCTISSNFCGRYGGGCHALAGVISGCHIQTNTAGDGGGAYLGTSSRAIMNCEVVGNTATNNGGGIWAKPTVGNPISVAECVVSNNTAGKYGGGFYGNSTVGNHSLLVSNLVITGNTSTDMGVAMYLSGGCDVVNTRVTANPGSYSVYVFATASTTILDCCTISMNGDYALYLRRYCEIRNTINYLNTGNNYVHYSEYGISYSNSCTWPTITTNGSGNITNNPLFRDTAAGNFLLQGNSPCINTGTNQPWMNGAKDLDGHGRIDRMSGLVDMGCYEFLNSGTIFTIR